MVENNNVIPEEVWEKKPRDKYRDMGLSALILTFVMLFMVFIVGLAFAYLLLIPLILGYIAKKHNDGYGRIAFKICFWIIVLGIILSLIDFSIYLWRFYY